MPFYFCLRFPTSILYWLWSLKIHKFQNHSSLLYSVQQVIWYKNLRQTILEPSWSHAACEHDTMLFSYNLLFFQISKFTAAVCGRQLLPAAVCCRWTDPFVYIPNIKTSRFWQLLQAAVWCRWTDSFVYIPNVTRTSWCQLQGLTFFRHKNAVSLLSTLTRNSYRKFSLIKYRPAILL